MKKLEWRFIDKSTWGEGNWQDEPDKMQWTDKQTGLPCLIVRNGEVTGALCGYVGVTKGHWCYGKDYDNLELNVHGGLTFAGGCMKENKEHGLCHIVEPGEDQDVWWLGFDCAHAWDLSPGMRANLRGLGVPEHCSPDPHEYYRNIGYVKRECRKLARQLEVK